MARILNDVVARAAEERLDASQIIGDPTEYAAATKRGRALSPGKTFLATVACLSGLYLAASLVIRLVMVGDSEWGALLFWAPPFAGVVAGVLGGYALDNRLPRGFDPSGRD